MAKRIYITLDNPMGALMALDKLLAGIEVRGESVNYLFNARGVLNQIFESLAEEELEKKEEEITT